MAHRLNTNKQFMIGNGILAFAVIFVVVIFVYMSMRLQQRKENATSSRHTPSH
jgi:preprotein translocase subunit YajC